MTSTRRTTLHGTAAGLDPSVAPSIPAVIRGSDEKRYVRRQCIDGAVRQTAAVGLLVLPSIAAVAIAFASAQSGRLLVAWILAALVSELLVLGALYRHREAQAAGEPEQALTYLHVGFASVGAVWGATTSVIDWSDTSQGAAFVMFPFMIAVLVMVQTAPLRSLFRAVQIPLVAVAGAGLLAAGETFTIVLAACCVVWYAVAEVLNRSMNRTVVEGHQMRWRADELVEHLRAERERLADANDRLAEQAVRDPLTGLLNRRGSMDALDAALRQRAETGEPVGLLFVDIDLFKSVNDSLGHRAGDELLQAVAQRMHDSMASVGAAVGRLGGDELVAIVPSCGDLDDLVRLAGRLRVAMGEPFALLGRERHVSVSIGVSRAPDHGTVATDLLRTANEGLHQAKAKGRNRVIAFDDSLREEAERRTAVEQCVRRAVVDGEIAAWFQPEIDALTGRLLGAEIVPRWVRADGDQVLGVDLQSPHVEPATLELLYEALRREAAAAVGRLGTAELPAGFRFRMALAHRGSMRTWQTPRLRALVDAFPVGLLTVSVTEEAMRSDVTMAAASLAALRTAGVRVALDDVTARSASLSMLRTVPLDELRIDRASLDSVETRSTDRAVVRAIVGLARDLGLGVAATHVDTGTQADALLALGCTRHQGDAYAAPLPLESFAALLAQSGAIAHPPQDSISVCRTDTREVRR